MKPSDLAKPKRDNRVERIRDFFEEIVNFQEHGQVTFNNLDSPREKWRVSFSKEDDQVLGTLAGLTVPDVILEFGSWLGKSAHTWCKNSSQDTIVVAVDTFLGSSEHWLDLSPVKEFSRQELNLSGGRPQLYEHFLRNMTVCGIAERVFAFPGTTQTFFEVFSKLKIDFPLIYVDAAHDYESVTRDLNFAYQLLPEENLTSKPKCGVIVGDDYETWPSVRLAVENFADVMNLPFIYGNNRSIFYSLTKDANAQLIYDTYKHHFGWEERYPKNTSTKNVPITNNLVTQNLQLLEYVKNIEESSSWKIISIYAKLKKFLLMCLDTMLEST